MTMPMPEARPAQTADSFAVALLIIQLLSLTLLIPISCVLVSFYRRVSEQRRRSNNKSRTVVINPPPSNDEHSLDNQTSPLTSTTFEDDAGNGDQNICHV